MEKPANSGKENANRFARDFKKARRGWRKVVPTFSSKSESKTNVSSSPMEADRTKAIGGLQSHSAGTNTGIDTFSHTSNASTGLEKNSTSAVDVSITPASRPTGLSHDAAAIASGFDFVIPMSHPPVVPSTSDTTEVTNAEGNAPRTDNPESTSSGLSAAPDALPLGNASPTVGAITSGAVVPASGTVPGSDKPISNADGTRPIPEKAVARTVTGSVEALDVNPAPTDGRTAQLSLWLRAKDAPRWNEALQTLRKENPEMHKVLEELEKTKDSLLESRERKTDELFKLDTAKPQEKAVVQRLKQYLPSLVAVRGIAMTAAAFDPHKIAPIVCACVFFSIDLALNKLSPEDKQKMRNIVFESVIAINEWISFESNFQKKSLDAIREEVKELEVLLTDQYLQALRLLCDILLSQNGSWTKRAGEKLTNKVVEYDLRLTKLKDHKSMWASKNRLIEETLAGEEDIAKVLKWIQQDGDPEKSLREIESIVTSEGRYPNCAEWILRREEFRDWSRHWSPGETQKSSRRMIWVNGPYGTGKTTIVYRIVSELQALSENYLRREPSDASADERQSDRPLRVIPYFCTARSDDSERADYYSTIIRALARKISLMPDFTLAQRAITFHGIHTRGLQKPVDIGLWKEFLWDLLKDDDGGSDFVFLIDALDECDPVEEPVNSEKLLEFMRDLMHEFSNLRILCSSRQHVPVKKYFSDEVLYPIKARSAPKDEIKYFIRDEIESRKNKQPESVFFKAGCEDIRERLKKSLIDHAEGMYEWVNIWLKLTIPIHNTRDTIRRPEDAEEMLKAIEDSSRETNDAYDKLRAGYWRLWKLGALKNYDEIRICVFRVILSSFQSLSVDHLTCLLRNWIGSDRLYYRLSIEEVESLYSNFLVSDIVNQVLRFTHSSAREFVMREILAKTSGPLQKAFASLIMKGNHRSIAKLFLDFVQRSGNRDAPHMLKAFDLSYFSNFGLQHCKYAAEKQSMFDEVWSDMIQRLLLPVESELAADIVAALPTLGIFRDRFVAEDPRRFIFRECEGKSYLLFPHALVWLGIIHTDDVCDRQLRNLRTAPSDTSTREGILRRFAERAATKSTGAGANALHIACLKGSAAAAKLVLKSTYYLYGKDPCTDLLSQQVDFPKLLPERRETPYASAVICYRTLTPFALAVFYHRKLAPQILPAYDRKWVVFWPEAQPISKPTIVEILLWFESRYLNTAREKEKENSSQATHRAQQWSHTCEEGLNALTYALLHFEEDDLCHLLQTAGPIAIDEPDKSGYTPLMTAARMGRLEIMRILVEDYHADLNVRGPSGESALDVAREEDQQAADYLVRRMDIFEPRQSVKSSSGVNDSPS